MCWKPEYIVLILTSTIIDYYSGIKIEESDRKKVRKLFLIFSLIGNLGILFGFKYFNFVSHSTREVLNYFNIFYNLPEFNVLLPVGISFYTFQSLSYTIDVYRKQRGAERHFGLFALYVSFFPQLVAGPIERSTRLIPQLRQDNSFSFENIREGLKQICWGYFKKLVVADRCAIYVEAVFSNPNQYSGSTICLAAVFFGFQVYCDFSGYSDIAIGSARMMGYRLMTNFRRPYFSSTFREFWQRWHISLSTWFKDYLYIPLGGSRVSISRWYLNIMTTFVISGVWHGANWTYIIWGALHGGFLVGEDFFKRIFVKLKLEWMISDNNRIIKFLKIVATFSLVQLAAIFFRSPSVSHALVMIKNIFVLEGPIWIPRNDNVATPIYALISIAILMTVEFKQEYFKDKFTFINNKIMIVRHFSYATVLAIIILLGVFDGGQFIYFEF
jgi:D-alanyl-lipoteichoic acid acyltransferase DltB (MBOAT superfamily)